jgi:hypothetical protein
VLNDAVTLGIGDGGISPQEASRMFSIYNKLTQTFPVPQNALGFFQFPLAPASQLPSRAIDEELNHFDSRTYPAWGDLSSRHDAGDFLTRLCESSFWWKG